MPSRLFRVGLLIAGTTFGSAGLVHAGPLPQATPVNADIPASALSDAHTATVLVFPFENNSHISNLDWMGDGLAELTSERLEERGFSVLSRQDRLAAIEKIGLPTGAPFSHATMVKIAGEADADEVVFGSYASDGKNITLEARVLYMSPAGLSEDSIKTTPLPDLVRTHAQFSAMLECALERNDCAAPPTNANGPDPASLPSLDAVESFVRGILAADDEPRLQGLREAARLAPGWDRPAFELGEVYFSRRDCDSALPWFSRVPPDQPDGPEASFNTGVCHLLRNDAGRAEAAFSALLERAHSTDSSDRLPELAQAHNNLGVARLRMMRWNEAEAEFERAAELDQLEPDYLVNLGIARLAEKQPATALEALQRATMMDPLDKGAQSLVSSTQAALGNQSDAAKSDSRSAGSSGAHTGSAAAPDEVELVRLARLSAHFDRSVLRPTATDAGGATANADSPKPAAVSSTPQ